VYDIWLVIYIIPDAFKTSLRERRRCFCRVGKPYSKVLENNILEFIVKKNYRMLKVSYGDPLLKRHKAMARITYLNELLETKCILVMD
jgi:hypothetical protein